MVLKSSNCGRNSGNTMRMGYFKQRVAKKEQSSKYISKLVTNIPVKAQEGKVWEVDVAQHYVDDGGLECATLFPNQYNALTYSLNKRKRWCLLEAVADGISDPDLADQEFKVTLVERVDHLHENGIGYGSRGYRANVTAYYDSHAGKCCLQPRKSFAWRSDLVRKGKELTGEKKRKKQKKPFHNQHFRGVQRKPKTVRVNKDQERQVAGNDTEQEIRYETVVPICTAFSYTTPQAHRDFFRRQEARVFRGGGRKMVHWYFTDALRPGLGTAHGMGVFKTQMDSDESCHHVETDQENDDMVAEEEYRASRLQEFSISDFLTSASTGLCTNRQRSSLSKTHSVGVTSVNPASDKPTRKYGKGSAIFMRSSEMDKFSGIREENFKMSSDEKDLESSASDAFGPSLVPTLNSWTMEAEVFEKSFSQCEVCESDFSRECLETMYGNSFEIGSCVPFTLAIRLQKAAYKTKARNGSSAEKEGDLTEDWWLLCQAAQSHSQKCQESKGCRLFNICLHSSTEEHLHLAQLANTQLREVLEQKDGAKTLYLDNLVLWSYDIVIHLAPHRNMKKMEKVFRRQQLDAFIPLETFSGSTAVCSVQQACQLMQNEPQHAQREADDDQVSLDVEFVESMCSICLTSAEDGEDGFHPFFMFLALGPCGHSFCRRCWQNHLTTSITSGHTVLTCMEYKCTSQVDQVALLSLVPHGTFSMWYQRLQSFTVESSGQWKWCPNATCGMVAKRLGSAVSGHSCSGFSSGVPVLCQCHHQWCLDCGQEAHWPLSCRQTVSYNKMLQQHGDQDGARTEAVVITWVKIKRCPACQYPIEKDGGCLHMTCSMCHREFCWVCKADWYTHSTGTWQGCNDKGEETVELDNSKVYPLPVQYYKQAIHHRYIWKQIDKTWHQTFTDFNHNMIYHKRKARKLDEGSPSVMLEVFKFLKQGHILLELGNILLSDTARSNREAKILRERLDVLEFSCNRFTENLHQPKLQVLRNVSWFQKSLIRGRNVIQQVCHSACVLRQQTKIPIQQWLLQRDHEAFVNFK